MPSLSLFGHKTAVNGDDLWCFAILAIILRVIQFAFVIPLLVYFLLNDYAATPDDSNCLPGYRRFRLARDGDVVTYVYWSFSFLLVLWSIIVELRIAQTTVKGAAIDYHNERTSRLQRLCCVKIIPLSVLRIFTVILGIMTALVSHDYCTNCYVEAVGGGVEQLVLCPSYVTLAVLIRGLVSTQLIEASVALFLYLYFIFKLIKPRRNILFAADHVLRKLPSRPRVDNEEDVKRRNKGCGWRLTCQLCCTCTSLLTCCFFGGMEVVLMHDFVDLSMVLEDFFDHGGHLDITLSDILEGLILVAQEQASQRERARQRTIELKKKRSNVVEFDDSQEDSTGTEDDNQNSTEAKFDHGAQHEVEKADEETEIEAGQKTLGRRQSVVRLTLRRTENGSPLGQHGIGAIDEEKGVGEGIASVTSLLRGGYSYEPQERDLLDHTSEADRRVMQEGEHFMKMALGIYGYGMYILNHQLTGCCRLTYGSAARGCHGAGIMQHGNRCCLGESTTIHGDNPFGFYTTAFLTRSGLQPEDIVYADFRTGVKRRPYCIVIDEEWKAIVVIVRGTFALEDAAADLSIRPIPLDDIGDRFGFDGTGEYVHSGMYASAEWIYEDIESQGLLEGLLPSEGEKIGKQSDRLPDYRLYITGHSLGAGVAAILSLMLHRSYPALRALCFEPPGCTMTKKAATKDYIVSYVQSSDIVPRLSLRSLENLRDDVLEMIARVRVPKYQVLTPKRFKRLRKLDPSEDDVNRKLHRRVSIPDSDFLRQLNEFRRYQADLTRERGDEGVTLLPPGKIVHLIHTNEDGHDGSCSESNKPYTAVWGRPEDFLEIPLTGTFMSDHDPATNWKELKRLATSEFAGKKTN